MNIGQKIYKYRKRHEMSQKAFAELCGLNRSYITEIENNHRKPGKEALERITEVLRNEQTKYDK